MKQRIEEHQRKPPKPKVGSLKKINNYKKPLARAQIIKIRSEGRHITTDLRETKKDLKGTR